MKVRSSRVLVLSVVLLIILSSLFVFPGTVRSQSADHDYDFRASADGSFDTDCGIYDDGSPMGGSDPNWQGSGFGTWGSGSGYTNNVQLSTAGNSSQNAISVNCSIGTTTSASGMTIEYTSNDDAIAFSGIQLFHSGGQTDDYFTWPNTSGTPDTITRTFSITGLTQFNFGAYNCSAAGATTCDNGFSITIHRITLHGTTLATNTPTPTLTPTIPPQGGGGVPSLSCPLLGQDSANFRNLPGNWKLAPTTLTNPVGTTSGLAFTTTNANAQLPLTLSRFNQYILTVRYHITNTTAGEIYLGLGNSPLLRVPIAGTQDTIQSFEVPSSNYEPNRLGTGSNADSYNLILIAPTTDDLIIDFICVKDASPSGGSTGTSGNGSWSSSGFVGIQAAVDGCTIPYDDTNNVFIYAISRIWHCGLKPAQEGIWAGVTNTFRFIQVGWDWLSTVVGNWITWISRTAGVLWAWFSGAAGNILIAVLNAAASLFNSLGLSDLLNRVVQFITNLPSIINAIVQTGIAVISIIGYWIGRFINTVLSVIFAVPALITSIITGFNTSAATVPVYAPSCNSSNPVLYAPCLSFYVLDHTVWDGPAFFIMPVFMGLIAWDVLMWAINTIKENFSK